MRGPAGVTLDILDDLADLGGGELALLTLDANERRLVVLVREPDTEQAAGEQRHPHHRHDQRNVLPEQPTASLRSRCGYRRDSDLAGRVIHSITSSARTSSERGRTRPSALAGLRFMTSSNLVGPCTGRPPGLGPRRIRST